jgi:hypothetical protein
VSGGQIVFVLTLVVPMVAGFLVGRWRFLLVLVGVWIGIAVFLRENNGWHGAGWGDFGIALNVIWAFLTLAAAVVGVGVRRAVRP